MKKQIRPSLAYLLPSFGALLWIGTFLIVVGLGRRMINGDGDLGRHITVGNYIVDHGIIPRQDVFSHTMLGQPLTPHEWLAEVIFALSHRLLQMNGPVLVSALVIATAFWLVYVLAESGRQRLFPVLFVAFLATMASSLHWLARPHIFTFLLLAAWMIVLHQMRSGKPGRWWLLPVLILVWANTHGAFIAGLITWALYGAGLAWKAFLRKPSKRETLPDHFWRYYLLGGVTSLLASLINPAGIGLWATSIGFITNRYLVGHTIEYLPPTIHNPSTWLFWIFSALLLATLAFKPVRQTSELLIPAAVWFMMAVYSARNIPLFLIVSAPLLAMGLEALLNRNAATSERSRLFQQRDARLFELERTIKGPRLPMLCVLAVIVGFRAGYHFDFTRSGNAYDPRLFPVEAVNWMEDHPQQGNMFNAFTWGGYLLYREWPRQRVFIDGQTDFYGEDLTRQYLTVINQSSGWQDVLTANHVDWVIMPAAEPIVKTLRSTPGWRMVYEDGTTVILLRVQ